MIQSNAEEARELTIRYLESLGWNNIKVEIDDGYNEFISIGIDKFLYINQFDSDKFEVIYGVPEYNYPYLPDDIDCVEVAIEDNFNSALNIALKTLFSIKLDNINSKVEEDNYYKQYLLDQDLIVKAFYNGN